MKDTDKALKSWFLGPKGENAEFVEELIVEVFRDYIYWRRNFHPEDGQVIKESDKISPEYEETIANFKQKLYTLLSELKREQPYFSPRYIGHMLSDLSIPAVVGYIATMLYNPNNVTSEASTVTTKYEIEAGKQLAILVGYDPKESWAHITSGGTIANLEALWVARNLKYFPLAVWKAIKNEIRKEYPESMNFETDGNEFANLNPWQLLNLSLEVVLSLRRDLIQHILHKKFSDGYSRREKKAISGFVDQTISKYSLHRLGYYRFMEIFKDELKGIKPGVILVPRTKHYSFVKVAEVLGIGSTDTLVSIPIGEEYTQDIEKLKDKIKELSGDKTPIIAVVGVLGTTEEGVIDRIASICELRKELEKEGISFSIHCDAAYGGYFASLLHDEKNLLMSFQQFENRIKEKLEERLSLSRYLYDSLYSLQNVDSVTIDPHKLGYVPYPCGSISFKDKKVRDLISFQAPYIFHITRGEGLEFIGRYILEGSKPGAAAAACYLTHKVIPLNWSGYGFLLSQTMKSAREIWKGLKRLNEPGEKVSGIKVIPLYEPHTNIVCFVANFEGNKSLVRMNRLVDAIYKEFSTFSSEVKPLQSYEFLISKTEFHYQDYKSPATDKLMKMSDINKNSFVPDPKEEYQTDKISVLRMTCMNPFLSYLDETGKYTYIEGFLNTLKKKLKKFSYRIFLYEDEEEEYQKIEKDIDSIAKEEDIYVRIEPGKAMQSDDVIDTIRKEEKEPYDFYIIDMKEPREPYAGSRVIRVIRKEKEFKSPIIIYTQYHKKMLENAKLKSEKSGWGENDKDKIISKKEERARIITEVVKKLKRTE